MSYIKKWCVCLIVCFILVHKYDKVTIDQLSKLDISIQPNDKKKDIIFYYAFLAIYHANTIASTGVGCY